MALKKLVPMLYTSNMKEAVDYYTTVLGFTCNEFDTNSGWASLSCDGVEIMLSIPNKHLAFDNPEFTGSLYIQTDNVKEWWNKLKDKTQVCYPLEDFKYGMREFAIFDNNGYLLQFGQEI